MKFKRVCHLCEKEYIVFEESYSPWCSEYCLETILNLDVTEDSMEKCQKCNKILIKCKCEENSLDK